MRGTSSRVRREPMRTWLKFFLAILTAFCTASAVQAYAPPAALPITVLVPGGDSEVTIEVGNPDYIGSGNYSVSAEFVGLKPSALFGTVLTSGGFLDGQTPYMMALSDDGRLRLPETQVYNLGALSFIVRASSASLGGVIAGAVTFTPVSAVPELGAGTLMLAGLVAILFLAIRQERRHAS